MFKMSVIKSTGLLWGLVIIMSFGTILSQETSEKPKPIYVDCDFSFFRINDNLVLMENYFAISRASLTYQPEGNRYRADFNVVLELYQADSLFRSKKWSSLNYVDSLSQISPGQQLFTLGNIQIPPGIYKAVFNINEEVTNRTTQLKYDIEVNGYENDGLSISDIELASSIQQDTAQTIFVKNGLRVNPNPSGVYGIHLPVLYFYSEIYNLAKAENSTGQYNVLYRVLDRNGNEVKHFDEKIKNKPGQSAVEIGGFNIVSLKSGTYFFEILVKDLDSIDSVSARKKFFVYREHDDLSQFAESNETEQNFAGVDDDQYDTATEEEIDEEFETAKYITTKDDRKTYKSLDLEGKKSFIREFWAKRDPSPGTGINEARRQYLKNVQLANERFSGTFKKGWKTDRGRILLVYGNPDETERFPFSTDNRAYEIWHFFSIQGGVFFVFVDKRGMGEYELVHSTARGELFDADWGRWIDPNR